MSRITSTVTAPSGPAGGDSAGTYPNPVSRAGLVARAEGLITQNFDRSASANSTALVSGTIIFGLVGLFAGDVVTNVVIGVDGAGSGLTLSKCALYSKTGTRLAVSADQGTAWQSTGIMVTPMGTPFPVVTTDVYYAAVLAIGTPPSLSRSANSVSSGTQIGTGLRSVAALGAQSDMPASATVVNGGGLGPWFGIS